MRGFVRGFSALVLVVGLSISPVALAAVRAPAATGDSGPGMDPNGFYGGDFGPGMDPNGFHDGEAGPGMDPDG